MNAYLINHISSFSIHTRLSFCTDVMVFVACDDPSSMTWWKGRSPCGPRKLTSSTSRLTDEQTRTGWSLSSGHRSRRYIIVCPPLPRLADMRTGFMSSLGSVSLISIILYQYRLRMRVADDRLGHQVPLHTVVIHQRQVVVDARSRCRFHNSYSMIIPAG